MHQAASFPCAVSLRRLLPQASFVGCTNLCVTDAVERSSDVQHGSLFAVIRGTKVDARQFISEAMARGASGLLVDMPIPESSIPQCVVTDVRSTYSRVCETLSGSPSRRLNVAGVHGNQWKNDHCLVDSKSVGAFRTSMRIAGNGPSMPMVCEPKRRI